MSYGTVEPGDGTANNIGTLSIGKTSGDTQFQFQNNSKMVVDLTGDIGAGATWDILDVTPGGTLILPGGSYVLNIEVIESGATVVTGDTIDIMKFSTIYNTPTFNVTDNNPLGNWGFLNSDGGTVTLQFTSVPEPGTFTLLVGAALLPSCLCRRRRTS